MTEIKTFPSIQGRCPACRGDSLFIGTGGYITCSRLDCPNPTAADELLHGEHVAAHTPLVCSDERHAAKVTDLEHQLTALRQVARRYCPACGRGDAAPTVTDWEQQKQRAEQAEELLRIAHDTSNKSEAERALAVQRADRAEAEIAACRRQQWPQLVAHLAACLANTYELTIDDVLAEAHAAIAARQPAPAATQTTDHHYLSTGCLHGNIVLPDGRTGHQYCQSDTGKAGAKTPAQCKFCQAPCTCPCHAEEASDV